MRSRDSADKRVKAEVEQGMNKIDPNLVLEIDGEVYRGSPLRRRSL